MMRLVEISPRENEVVVLLLQGLSNKQMAKKLGCSDQTVKNHLTSIYAKLGARGRTEAAMIAMNRNSLGCDAEAGLLATVTSAVDRAVNGTLKNPHNQDAVRAAVNQATRDAIHRYLHSGAAS